MDSAPTPATSAALPHEPPGPSGGGAARPVDGPDASAAWAGFLSGLAETVRRLDDPDAIVAAAIRRLRAAFDADRCTWIAFDADEDHFSHVDGACAPGVPPIEGRFRLSTMNADALRALRAGETCVVADTAAELADAAERGAHDALGVRALVAVPLHKGGRLVAVLSVQMLSPRPWRPEEVRLLEQATGRCWEAIERARVARSLAASEARLSRALAASGVGTWEWDATTDRHVVVLGEQRIVEAGADLLDRVHPDDRAAVQAAFARAGAADGNGIYEVEYRATMPGRGLRWRRSQGAVTERSADGAPLAISGVVIDVTERREAELERERLLAAEQSARIRAEQLQQAAAALSAARTPDQVARAALEAGTRAIGSTTGTLFIDAPDAPAGSWLQLAHSLGYDARTRERMRRIARNEPSPIADAIATRSPLLVASRAELVARYPQIELLLAPGALAAGACFPLLTSVSPQAPVLGVLGFGFRQDRRLDEDELRFLTTLAQFAAQALERARLLEAERDARSRAEDAQGALLEGRARLALALEAARSGTFDWDIRTGASAWDDELLALYGLRRDDFGGSFEHWLQSVHPEDRERARAAVRDALVDGSYALEFRIVRADDGAVRWMHGRGRVHEDNGTPARLVGINIDITERRRFEEALEHSESRFRLMADGVATALWVTDADGRIAFVNRHYREAFGLADQPADGGDWRPIVHPEDRERYASAFAAALRTRGDFHARVRMRSANRGWRWIDASGTARISAQGEFLGHVGTNTDITDLIASQDALREADRRKDEFLATLSHELRNPLAPIRTAARLLGLPQLPPERLQWARGVIQRQVSHVALLLDDLLDVARITQGKLVLRPQPVDLAAVVESALEAARPQLVGRRHRLAVRLPETLPALQADPLRLSQVLSNLLTNAAKFTEQGGHLELAVRTDHDAVELSVSDDGIGIAPQALGRIFKMFSQVRSGESRGEGGLGIGLALVKGIVELHGGSVRAESAGLGRGSTFRIRLPLTQPASAIAAATPAPPPARSAQRVLVADDNADAADSLALLLRLAGHEVGVAYGGREALAVAGTLRPDAALLDLGMPDLDGCAVARALRGEPWAGALQLIAVTGWGQEGDKQRTEAAGFDLHLTKPIDLAVLARVLGSDLDGAG